VFKLLVNPWEASALKRLTSNGYSRAYCTGWLVTPPVSSLQDCTAIAPMLLCIWTQRTTFYLLYAAAILCILSSSLLWNIVSNHLWLIFFFFLYLDCNCVFSKATGDFPKPPESAGILPTNKVQFIQYCKSNVRQNRDLSSQLLS